MFTTLVRTVILYLIIIAGIRLMGKRQVGELEPSELVLSLLIADLASVPMQDQGIPLLAGIIPILTLLSLAMIFSVATMKSITLRAILCGRPSVVIRSGKFDQEEMRIQGYTDLSLIKYAILETNGQLSVLPYANQRPVTAQQMDISCPEGGLPLILISDGHLLERNLRARGRNLDWLNKQLVQRGCTSPQSVFLMTLDEDGAIYLARKGDAK